MGTSDNTLTLHGLIHDLANVFQTILQASDLIASDPRHSDVAAIIARSAEQGRRILSDCGGSDPCNFVDAVTNATQFVLDSVGTAVSVRFRMDADSQLMVPVRASTMERILINLFLNSAEAVRAAGLESVEIRVSAIRDEAGVVVTVADDGPGIPESLIPMVFTPRFSAIPDGEGLGLNIVSTAVVNAGGSIAVANGDGAIFTIRFPFCAAIAASQGMGH